MWPALALAGLVGGVVGGIVGGTAVLVLRPALPVAERGAEPRGALPGPGSGAPPSPPPATEPPHQAATAPTPEPPPPSRSRGRPDWMFFFKPGDRLQRMGTAAALGMVIRAEKAHTFPDGTMGPAYVVQVPEGGQRFFDADELERSARIE